MDRRLLTGAYDRSAEGYDERFRELQRVKFRAARDLLQPVPAGALCLDAGGGTALLCEWLREERPDLAAASWLVIDLSLGMLRIARRRAPLTAAADLARPPLRDGSCALVAAFTSLLDDVPGALHALGALLVPRGQLVVSFLRDEAPPAAQVARSSGLRLAAGPIDAGQDQLYALRKG
jgi:ubiquinone/menaquinone biosynthesis C-methylase UbiE